MTLKLIALIWISSFLIRNYSILIMRIAVNTRFLIKDKLEGIGWFSYEVVSRMVREHPDDEFLFFFDRPFDQAFIFGDNVRPLQLPPPARHPILWYLWFEWAVPAALKRHNVDVFFSPDAYCSLSTKVPTAMVTHDIAHVHYPELVPGWVGKYYNYFVPRFLAKADQVVTVSEFVKKDIIQHYQTPADKISVACNGSRDLFRPLTEQEKLKVKAAYTNRSDYFFYVGAVHPRKNVHRLIKAFDLFKKKTPSNLKLLIAGRFAWQTGAVKSAYDQAAYKRDIQFLGYISEDQLMQLIAAALALTYVSNFEGFGIPLLEALQCEVPVITSDVSSMPEVVGDAGITVDPRNIHEIAEAMARVYTTPQLQKIMIQKGIVQRQKFTWDRAAKVCYQAIQKASRK